MSGVRAELVFESPESCPVATASSAVEGPLTEVSWAGNDSDTVTEQFTASTPDGQECLGESRDAEFEEVFDYGPQQIYEFERTSEDSCVCEYVEEAIGPVTETYARDGNLHVTLHARDVGLLRDLIGELKSRFGTVRIEYLVQGRGGGEESELVPVDLRKLTDRQREVLGTAHEMGYFDYPRASNAGEVADALGIEPSTFTEHLNAAQSKLLEDLLVRE